MASVDIGITLVGVDCVDDFIASAVDCDCVLGMLAPNQADFSVVRVMSCVLIRISSLVTAVSGICGGGGRSKVDDGILDKLPDSCSDCDTGVGTCRVKKIFINKS